MNLMSPIAIRSAAWMLAITVIALDQASKLFMRMSMVPSWEDKITVLPVFNLVHYWNKGIAFSLFSSGPLSGPGVLIAISLIITLVVIAWLMNAWRLRPALAYGLIIGGALSNVMDRFMHGAVFDFVQLHWGDHYWPAFNLADSAIVLGVGCLFIDMMLERPALPKEEE